MQVVQDEGKCNENQLNMVMTQIIASLEETVIKITIDKELLFFDN